MPSPAAPRDWSTRATSLWQRIQAHDFDTHGAALPFTQRLARDNHWTLTYAVRVVEEYRRFCFLACVHEGQVTPSDQVDQAWHLHLLYTRDYWDIWCPQVLGRSLHHGPTRGGAEEGSRFDQQYADTRHAYLSWFGEHPPADIWPGARERFGRDTAWLRVNKHDYWLLRKPRRAQGARGMRGTLQIGVVSAFLLLLSFGAGNAWAQDQLPDLRPTTMAQAGNDLYALAAGPFLKWYALICIGVIGGATASRAWRSRRRGEGRGLGHLADDPYRAALLYGDERRVLLTALAKLMDEGNITVSMGGQIRAKDSPDLDAHALDHAIFESASATQGLHGTELFRTQPVRVQREIDRIRRSSEEAGLILRPQEQPQLEWIALSVPALVAAPRLIAAVPAERPVGYLIILLCIATVAGFFLIKHSISQETEGGRRLRQHLKRKTERLVKRVDGQTEGQLLLLATAVYGSSALASTPLDDVRQALPKHRSSDSGSGGCTASGCGGGGCGGGGCGG